MVYYTGAWGVGGEGVGEGEGGAGLTWLIVIVVNLPVLLLTCWAFIHLLVLS